MADYGVPPNPPYVFVRLRHTSADDVITWSRFVYIFSGVHVERRSFLKVGAAAGGSILIPVFGNAIAAEELLNPMAVQFKKSLADAAMNAATKAGASYCDVRIGRYMNQFINTRDQNVQNIVNTQSSRVDVS